MWLRAAALAVKTGITKSGGLINDIFVTDLHDELDGMSCAKAMLSSGLAQIRDKNAF